MYSSRVEVKDRAVMLTWTAKEPQTKLFASGFHLFMAVVPLWAVSVWVCSSSVTLWSRGSSCSGLSGAAQCVRNASSGRCVAVCGNQGLVVNRHRHSLNKAVSLKLHHTYNRIWSNYPRSWEMSLFEWFLLTAGHGKWNGSSILPEWKPPFMMSVT